MDQRETESCVGRGIPGKYFLLGVTWVFTDITFCLVGQIDTSENNDKYQENIS